MKIKDNIAGYFRKIVSPSYYQGGKITKDYFEGWYFKHEAGDVCYSFIAGISRNAVNPHSFIQVIRHNKKTESHYFEFDINQFSASKKSLYIEIAGNVFSAEGIRLDLKKKDYNIYCDINYGHFSTVPNAMGIFSLIPGLQCNHAIVSMAHTLRGKIIENKKLVSMENGIGYIEKDFGCSFPEKYTWLQSNINNEIVVSFANATVPIGKHTIDGHICIIKLRDKLYNLSTYAAGKVSSRFLDNKLFLDVTRGKTALNIIMECADSMPLKAPEKGVMSRTVSEGLRCNVIVDFTAGKKVNYHGEGFAAFEYAIKETVQ